MVNRSRAALLRRVAALTCALCMVGAHGLACAQDAGAETAAPLADQAAATRQALGPSQQWVAASQIEDAAKRAVDAWLRPQIARWEVRALKSATSGYALAAGEVKLVARPLPQGQTLTRRMTVWVDVLLDERSVRAHLVNLEVKAFQQAYVAVRDLSGGSALMSELLDLQEVDVAAGGKLAWQGAIDGQMLRNPVAAGQYLGAANVRAKPSVAQGESVQLSVRYGDIAVTMPALALQTGEVGQMIQVRADKARGPVLARVVRQGWVEVQQ